VNAGSTERWRVVLGIAVLAAGGFLLLRGAAGSLLRAVVPEAPGISRTEVVTGPVVPGNGGQGPVAREAEEEASAGGVVVSGEFRNDPFAPIPGQAGTPGVATDRRGAATGAVPSSPGTQLPPPPPLQGVSGQVPAVERPDGRQAGGDPQGGVQTPPQGAGGNRQEGRDDARSPASPSPSPSPAPENPQVSLNAVVGGPWQYVALVSHGGAVSWVSEGDLIGGWVVSRVSRDELVLEEVKTGKRVTVRAEASAAPESRQGERGRAGPAEETKEGAR